jgi:Tfp pilus assembly protein PilX
MGIIKRHVGNADGSAIIVAILILLILTLGGITAIDFSNIEVKYSRNDIERKQFFYYTESAGREVAYDVDKTTGTRYAVLDTSTPIIVTATANGNKTSNPSAAQVTDYVDPAWPINTNDVDSPELTSLRSREYGYRVYYTGLGLMPKGFGANFSSFVFDIATRAQTTVGGNTEVESAAIVQGFRKIGPKS